MLTKGSDSLLVQVTSVVGQRLFFAAGDSLNLNQTLAPSGDAGRSCAPSRRSTATGGAGGVRRHRRDAHPDDQLLHRRRRPIRAAASHPPHATTGIRRTSTTRSAPWSRSTSRTCRSPTTSPTAVRQPASQRADGRRRSRRHRRAARRGSARRTRFARSTSCSPGDRGEPLRSTRAVLSQHARDAGQPAQSGVRRSISLRTDS